MSYLKLPNGIPDFAQAVISLWFRVPMESVIAATGHTLPTQAENFYMMQSVLPLITFGNQQKNENYVLVYEDTIHGAPPENPVTLVEPVGWSQDTPYDVDPSYIGVKCEDERFRLVFNIQTAIFGSYDSLLWFCTRRDYQAEHGVPVPGDGLVGDYQTTIADGTHGIENAQPEWFNVTSDQEFEPDTWHHVLLSFDVGGEVSIGADHPSSSCQLWYAVDDVDYRGWENLRPYRNEDDGLGPNIIVTSNAYNKSGFGEDNLVFNHYVPTPTGGASSLTVPSSGGELGLPAASHYVEGIFRAEMAELQIFTGVTLDTGEVSSRRAFVDADGKPVEPTGTEDDPRGPAEKLLGKRPEVMLHGNSKWQEGYNTGSLGAEIEIATDGTQTLKKLPAGQFTPVAGIEKYKPEPALTETATA